MHRPVVVFGLLGTVLDRGPRGPRRWDKWRPTVGLCAQPDLEVARLELLHPPDWTGLAREVAGDVRSVSPRTDVVLRPTEFADPWDFEGVYGALFDVVRGYPFDPEREDYLVHITTGTHVAQICWFLLVEARQLPGRLVQTMPGDDVAGRHDVIDLGLGRYDAIARRFAARRQEHMSFLKGGIETRNPAFNALMDRIEAVASRSDAPLLLTGPTGAGKSALARRIYDLKRRLRRVKGPLVEVNCATLRGDQAMSALFGHRRGAYTGATQDRAGLLKEADGGLLFLDEIGELGLDEQAMLLRAVEARRFLPVGSDQEASSDFRLIAGTNRDLHDLARAGRFREDLLARLDLWTFRLPGLAERPEDIEPNLDFELDRVEASTGRRVTLNREARARFLRFAEQAPWPRNFRDLTGAVERLATLCDGGRVDVAGVEDEIARLRSAWRTPDAPGDVLDALVPGVALDRFDRVQLLDVVAVCRASPSLSEAGRTLFAASRARRTSTNDADRLRKYLARFGLTFDAVQAAHPG
jgi:transcriptional regulatory protein RtcR